MEICQFDYFEQCHSANAPGNPFDVEWTVSVTCPDGTIKRIDGFFDGGNRFVFRFMPEQLGEYRYQTDCRLPELNGKSGSFHCIPPREGNHGKVTVKDRYWFAYADGTPYFEAGTTCYAWIHQNEELRMKHWKLYRKAVSISCGCAYSPSGMSKTTGSRKSIPLKAI